MRFLIAGILLLLVQPLFSQSFTSYLTGDTLNADATASGGICMMGGATENDEAMKWFLERANGGDVLVLRASGSDGYNNYFYSELGVTINSVESIVFNNIAASDDPYIHQRISEAEAIWFAGGNQWNYVNYWRNSPVDSLINEAIQDRNIVIGGTSAGMAILGGHYFSAQNGTVTSATALNNPYTNAVIVDSAAFLNNAYLENVVTDTHYDDPDRKGRHVVFLARMLADYGVDAKGIACDEFTSVCIDTDGIAYVYGEYPDYDDNAYFLQVNCEHSDPSPESITAGSPLDWNLNQSAIKVYNIKGTLAGNKFFDLNDWLSGAGGTWHNWSVDQGSFAEAGSTAPECIVSVSDHLEHQDILIYPNPTDRQIFIESTSQKLKQITISTFKGEFICSYFFNDNYVQLNTEHLHAGAYFLKIKTDQGVIHKKLIKQ